VRPRDRLLLSLRVQRRRQERPHSLLRFRRENQSRRGAVAEIDLVYIDMAPGVLPRVHDLQHALLPDELAHVPAFGMQLLLIASGCRADHLAPDAQVDAGLAGMVAAADEEMNVGALDLERLRCQATHRRVAAPE